MSRTKSTSAVHALVWTIRQSSARRHWLVLRHSQHGLQITAKALVLRAADNPKERLLQLALPFLSSGRENFGLPQLALSLPDQKRRRSPRTSWINGTMSRLSLRLSSSVKLLASAQHCSVTAYVVRFMDKPGCRRRPLRQAHLINGTMSSRTQRPHNWTTLVLARALADRCWLECWQSEWAEPCKHRMGSRTSVGVPSSRGATGAHSSCASHVVSGAIASPATPGHCGNISSACRTGKAIRHPTRWTAGMRSRDHGTLRMLKHPHQPRHPSALPHGGWKPRREKLKMRKQPLRRVSAPSQSGDDGWTICSNEDGDFTSDNGDLIAINEWGLVIRCHQHCDYHSVAPGEHHNGPLIRRYGPQILALGANCHHNIGSEDRGTYRDLKTGLIMLKAVGTAEILKHHENQRAYHVWYGPECWHTQHQSW